MDPQPCPRCNKRRVLLDAGCCKECFDNPKFYGQRLKYRPPIQGGPVRTQIILDPEMYSKLQSIADKNYRKSKSEAVRDMIKNYREK